MKGYTFVFALPMTLCLVDGGNSYGEQQRAAVQAQVAPHTANNPTLKPVSVRRWPEAEAVIKDYVLALRTADAELLLKVASKELRQRIEQRGPAGSFAKKTSAFLAREGRNLMRQVPTVSSPTTQMEEVGVGVRAVELMANGAVAAVTLAAGGTVLPKPFYLVREEGSYKVNVVPPTGELTSSVSRYKVQNNDYEEREFSCTDYGPYTIARFPAQRLVSCRDSCHGGIFGWFDGTTFETQVDGRTASVDCDYNTWGVDMFIQDGVPTCVGDEC